MHEPTPTEEKLDIIDVESRSQCGAPCDRCGAWCSLPETHDGDCEPCC